MDLYTQSLGQLYQKYDELIKKDSSINKELSKKQKEQERKEESIKILSDKLVALSYREDVLRGKYKKEDRKLKRNIVKVVLPSSLLILATLIAFLFQIPIAMAIFGLLLISGLCATNHINEVIRMNKRPLKQRKRIEATYDLDAVLVESIDLTNTIKALKKNIASLEKEKTKLELEKETMSEMIDLVDEVISRLQDAKEKVIWHLANQNSSLEEELNTFFQNDENVLKLIKKINLEKEDE